MRSRTLDVDLLMVVAAIGAASIGQIFDGALLIVIFATSGALEDAATKRTEDSVKGLLDLAPDRATRIDADGVEQPVNPQDLRVGELVIVRPVRDSQQTESSSVARRTSINHRSPENRYPSTRTSTTTSSQGH